MDKFTIYCGARFSLYQCLYGVLFLITSAIVALILSLVVRLIIGLPERGIPNSIAQSQGIGFSFDVVFGLFFLLCALVLSYFTIKLSLKKMFFKPYKKFLITTAIEKITPKMVFTFWGLKILLGIPISCLCYCLSWFLSGDAKSKLDATTYSTFGSAMGMLLGIAISFCIDLVISRYFVRKYATVTSKQSVMH